MTRAAALALAVAATVAGCTEARGLDPSASDGGLRPALDGGADAGPPMMTFVPYSPPTTGAAGGAGANAGTAAGPGGAFGGGPGGMFGGGGGGPGPGSGGMATAPGGAAGSLTPTMFGLRPVAISRDGSVVAGTDERTGSHAMRWTPSAGATALQPLTAGHDHGEVAFIDGEGIIVGRTWSSQTGRQQAVIWTAFDGSPSNAISTGYTGDCTFLPVAGARGSLGATCLHPSGVKEAYRVFSGLPMALGFLDGTTNSEIVAASEDGAIFVGNAFDAARTIRRAFYWSGATGMVEIPPLVAGDVVVPRAVSDGGGLVACDELTTTTRTSFLWQRNGPELPISGCKDLGARVVAIATKGALVLGGCAEDPVSPPLVEMPFLATFMGMARLLPTAASPFKAITPVGISTAGDVVVGRGFDVSSGPALVIWAGGAAPRVLRPMLPGPTAVDLTVTALSADGTTVVGDIPTGDGSRRGWLLRFR